MKILKLYPDSINEKHIREAADALEDGKIIIYPTDSVYALGCDALNGKAVELLCRIKGLNPDKNYLSIVCSDLSQASEYAKIDNRAFKILKAHLPGPFTFILPAATTLPKIFKGRKSVGLRIPNNPIATELAGALGHPILTTSVPFDPEDPDSVEEACEPESIAMSFASTAQVCLAIDGGRGGNVPSTVVDIIDSSDPQILRQGTAQFYN